MCKKILLGLIAIGVVAAAFAEPWRKKEPPDPAQRAEMRRKHLEELHQKLALQPDQEAAWLAFVEKTQPPPPPEREDFGKLKAPQRLERMLEHLRQQEANLELHLAALTELYHRLTPEQQEVFDRTPPPPHFPPPPRPDPDAP
ncbi:Spy/CpxP family protein refolding chaperone [bacterium]|nr:Spy/CpxP family protein refolding chaperone [bacterium]